MILGTINPIYDIVVDCVCQSKQNSIHKYPKKGYNQIANNNWKGNEIQTCLL